MLCCAVPCRAVAVVKQDINWEKIRYMVDRLELTPWHVGAPDRKPLVSYI
jgi:hypothetical protein